MQMNPDFSELPYEIQFNYLLYLPVTDIANYCKVSTHATNICTDDSFWKAKIDHDFPTISQYKPEGITYQQQFLDLLHDNSVRKATKEGRLDILLYLMSQGKFPGQVDAIFAAKNGHINILNMLESYKIYPTIVGADWAAMNGKVNSLEWLEARGILPHQRVVNYFVSQKHPDVLQWLSTRKLVPN